MTNDGEKVANFVDKIFSLIQSEKLDANNATYSVAYTLGVIMGRAQFHGTDPKELKANIYKAIEHAMEASLENEKRNAASSS